MAVEWSLVLFTVIAGAGAGLLAFAGVGEFFGAGRKPRFVAAACAIALFVAGGCASLVHLGNPGNFMAAATNLFSFSPISLELIFLGLGVVVAAVYLVVVNREGGASRIVGICGIAVGALFCYFSGHGYEIISVRPAWATPALSFSYAFSALAIGGFLFLALQAALKDGEAPVKGVALVVLAVAALQAVSYLAYGALAPLGESAGLFWGGALVVGGLVSVAAGVLVWMRGMQAMSYVGALCAVAGALAFRAVMWLAGSPYIVSFFEVGAQSRSLFPLG